MKLEVNVSKKVTIPIIAVIVLVAGIFSVFAFGTSNPQTLGHSIDEIAAPAGCQSGQVLSYTGSSWQCVSLGSVSCTSPATFTGDGGSSITTATLDVPSKCINSLCNIIMTFSFNGFSSQGGTVSSYYQVSPQNIWASSNSGGTNGNLVENIMESTVNSKTVTLSDDGAETSPTKWTLTIPPGMGGSGWAVITIKAC